MAALISSPAMHGYEARAYLVGLVPSTSPYLKIPAVLVDGKLNVSVKEDAGHIWIRVDDERDLTFWTELIVPIDALRMARDIISRPATTKDIHDALSEFKDSILAKGRIHTAKTFDLVVDGVTEMSSYLVPNLHGNFDALRCQMCADMSKIVVHCTHTLIPDSTVTFYIPVNAQ